MKVEKNIKLSIGYENIEISPNWVAFSISRTLENTVNYQGIVRTETWNNFLKDPFSIIPYKEIVKDNKIVLLKQDNLSSLSVFKNVLDNDFDFLEIDDNDFSYDSYKKNPDYSIYRLNYLAHQTYDNRNNCHHFYFLSDLDRNVAYFELIIDLPYLNESKYNKAIFENLLNLLNNYSDLIQVIPSNKDLYKNNSDFIQAFENIIYSIDNPYISDENDFSAPQPEFLQSIGTLKFKIPGFNKFNEFFEITKKYVEIDSLDISKQKVGIIITLAVLHSHLNDIVHEDLFNLFPDEYKIAQAISLEYKLTPKNYSTKKLKI